MLSLTSIFTPKRSRPAADRTGGAHKILGLGRIGTIGQIVPQPIDRNRKPDDRQQCRQRADPGSRRHPVPPVSLASLTFY